MTFSNSPGQENNLTSQGHRVALFLLPLTEFLLRATPQLPQVLGGQPSHLCLCSSPVLVLQLKRFTIRPQNAQALDTCTSVLCPDSDSFLLL